MNQQEAVEKVSNLLDEGRKLIEEALTLGREYGVPVDLTQTGVGNGDDMWYVDEATYRQEYIQENYYDYDSETYNYIPRELTPEEKAEVETRMNELRDNGGFSDDGYKVLGWMSSSTNC